MATFFDSRTNDTRLLDTMAVTAVAGSTLKDAMRQ